MEEPLFLITLLLNALWLGLAFGYFSLRSTNAAKLLIKGGLRKEPTFIILSQSLKFLGGMNLALAVLALLIFINFDIFPHNNQKALFACVFGLAHGSQFIFNFPIAMNEYKKSPYLWTVLTGPMLFIFLIDLILAVLNMFCAIVYRWKFY